MSQDPGHTSASDVVAHLVPTGVLAQLRDLALKLQREEAFQSYIARRLWLIVPAGLVFALVSIACVIGVAAFRGLLSPSTLPLEFGAMGVILLGALFLASMMTQIYTLFSCLEKRAFPRAVPLPNRLRSLLLLNSLFVALPLVLLAIAVPAAGTALMTLVIFAPVVYTLVDH